MADWPSRSPLEIVQAGKWRRALFFTYALSLGFFEGVLLPPLRRGGLREARIFADVQGIADAIGEGGVREAGRAYSVHPVQVRRQGVFHPKLMLLDGAEPHMVIGSGNLTFGGYGANLEVFDHLIPSAHPACFSDLADLVEDLATTPQVAAPGREDMGSWVERLRGASAGAREGSVRIVHSLSQPIADQLAAFALGLGGAMRLTVAAPYFGSTRAVEALADKLSVADLAVHVPSLLPRNGEAFDFAGLRVARPIVLDVVEAASAGRPEHLKLLEIECAKGLLTLSGSINASTRALSEPRNVELGVIRLRSDSQVSLGWRPHEGALPTKLLVEPDFEGKAVRVLHASVVGDHLKGTVLSAQAAGRWIAAVDAGGQRTHLGSVDADTNGEFEGIFPALAELALGGGGRAILILARDGTVVKGFLTFSDMLGLTKRVGAAVGPLIRVAFGGDDDDDLAAVLEWFAMNPDASLAPWRRGSKRGPQGTRPDLPLPIELLDVGSDELEGAEPRRQDEGLGGASKVALDRLLRRLRGSLTAPPSNERSSSDAGDRQEEEDLPSENLQASAPTDRTVAAYERLFTVLSERVANEPRAELTRLLEIGAHVLVRRNAPRERVQQVLEDWSQLAVAHLTMAEPPEELDHTTVYVVVLAAAIDGRVVAARRRLLHFLGGSLSLAEDFAEAGRHCWPTIARLAEQCVGDQAMAETADAISSARCTFDDIVGLLAAARGDVPFPEIHLLDKEPEVEDLRNRIRRGRTERVFGVDGQVEHCPKCHTRLPRQEFHRLAHPGLASAGCCGSLLINRRP